MDKDESKGAGTILLGRESSAAAFASKEIVVQEDIRSSGRWLRPT